MKLLRNRVRLMSDGLDRYWIENKDGSVFSEVSHESICATGPCFLCGAACGMFNLHQRNVLVTSKRVCMSQFRRFCSTACRERWWNTVRPKTVFGKIDTPATIETYLCPCTGRKELVGVGDILTRVVDGVLETTDQNGSVLATTDVRGCVGCERCHGQRVMREAPEFFYGDKNDPMWTPSWAQRIDFDKDLELTVFDSGPGQFQFMWWTSENVCEVMPELVIERRKFNIPVELNKWWTGVHAFV